MVWLLAWCNGIETLRLIIIGNLRARAMLVAFNTWLLLRAFAGDAPLQARNADRLMA